MDFGQNTMNLFENKATAPLLTNEAGQYVKKMLGDPPSEKSVQFQEVMMNEPVTEEAQSQPAHNSVPAKSNEMQSEPNEPGQPSESSQLQIWSRNDSFISKTLTTGKQGPAWQNVRRRRVLNSCTGDVIFDEWISPTKAKKQYHQKIPAEVFHVTTGFHFIPQEKLISAVCLSVHNVRQFESQVCRR